MEKKHGLNMTSFLCGCIAAVLLCSCGLLVYLYGIKPKYDELSNRVKGTDIEYNALYDKLGTICEYIADCYYKDTQLEEDVLYKAIVESLGDPYSQYYTKEEYNILNKEFDAEYYGIGISLEYDKTKEVYCISEILEDSVLSDSGLKVGDEIKKINGVDIKLLDYDTVGKLIDDAEDIVLVAGEDSENYAVKKKNIKEKTVEYKELGEKTGMLVISDFLNSTYQEYYEYKEIIQGTSSLIVDLRDNVGGKLDGAIQLIQDLMPQGKIVELRDRFGNNVEYMASGKGYSGNIIILVNDKTASAAEVFAAAFRDNHYAKIVGTKTFGKGIVQTIYELMDGSALKLTTAYYYTPNNTCINGVGIEPDYIAEEEQLEKALEIIGQEDLKDIHQ